MADIKKELNDIKNAVYGKEVRGSIHDGIKKINDEVENATDLSESAKHQVENIQQQVNQLVVEGDSSVEAAQARVDAEGKSFPTLKARLDEKETQFSSQLEQTDRYRRFESMINRKEPDGLYISWVDDDGYEEVYHWYKQYLIDYPITITSALQTQRHVYWDEGFLTREQIEELSELGMEFLSHTHYNTAEGMPRPIDMTEEQLDLDFRLSQQIMKDLGLNWRGLVLPFGDNSPLIQKVARRYFDYVIGTGVSGKAGYVLYPGEVDNYYITRVTLEHSTGFDYVKQRLDEAYENGVGWIVFVSHARPDYTWYSDEYCRQIIEYSLGKGFKFITTEEGVERFGNIGQFGNTKIGSDGSINSTELGKVRHVPHEQDVYRHDIPLTDYPKNVISFSEIVTQYAGEFPLAQAGVLYTYRHEYDSMSYQKYITSRDHKIFTRLWDVSRNRWGDWFQDDIVQYLGRNGITHDEEPNTPRLKNKISYTQIDSSRKDGFPEQTSGMLINYAHEPDNIFPYQEYHLYRQPRTFRRYWSSNGWSDWEETQNVRILEDNVLNGTHLISDFSLGITLVNITGEGDPTGLPESFGTLITYKNSNTTNGYNYQEFKGLNNYNKYIRHVKSDGTWNVWRKYVTESV